MHRNILLLASIFLMLGCEAKQHKKEVFKLDKNTSTTKDYFLPKTSKKYFTTPVVGLSQEEQNLFVIGKSVFRIPWVQAPASTTARDGLGPLFGARTCLQCHPGNGSGIAVKKNGTMTRSLLIRFSHKHIQDTAMAQKVGFEPDSSYGAQLSRFANLDIKLEGTPVVTYKMIQGTYPDGTKFELRKPNYKIIDKGYGDLDADTIIAPRVGSALVGLGQLGLISEKDILAYEDEEDKDGDGISGKANYAYDIESNKTMLGRFTWKASATTIKLQSAAAAHNDMGLSSPLFPMGNCTSKQKACIEAEALSEDEFDLPAKRLDAVTFYLSNLAIPKQRDPEKHLEGEKIFKNLSCTSCHVPSYKTASGITISPYTDLLLHDMGEELADGRSEFLAIGSEWRTAPLWGKGLQEYVAKEANFLHDARARSIEEAILWHGGEATKAKEAFMLLKKEDRQKVLEFLNSI